MKIRLVGVKYFHAEGWKDEQKHMAKLNVPFLKFAESLKICRLVNFYQRKATDSIISSSYSRFMLQYVRFLRDDLQNSLKFEEAQLERIS